MNTNYVTQPYYNRQPMYGQPNYNQQQFMQPMYAQQMQQNVQQPVSQILQTQTGIQGKSVDSIDVVRAMEIPLDGSVSYFPLTDGTAIITKQLQQDGTSKTIIYKPTENEKIENTTKYMTAEDLDKAIKKIDNNSVKDELKILKRQIKNLTDELEDLKDRKE